MMEKSLVHPKISNMEGVISSLCPSLFRFLTVFQIAINDRGHLLLFGVYVRDLWVSAFTNF